MSASARTILLRAERVRLDRVAADLEERLVDLLDHVRPARSSAPRRCSRAQASRAFRSSVCGSGGWSPSRPVQTTTAARGRVRRKGNLRTYRLRGQSVQPDTLPNAFPRRQHCCPSSTEWIYGRFSNRSPSRAMPYISMICPTARSPGLDKNIATVRVRPPGVAGRAIAVRRAVNTGVDALPPPGRRVQDRPIPGAEARTTAEFYRGGFALSRDRAFARPRSSVGSNACFGSGSASPLLILALTRGSTWAAQPHGSRRRRQRSTGLVRAAGSRSGLLFSVFVYFAAHVAALDGPGHCHPTRRR